MFDEFKNAFQRQNNAHIQLIIINVVVFLMMAVLFFLSRITETGFYDLLHDELFSIPPKFDVFITRPWTIITYAFMHDLGGILHILMNMISLYWFGRLFVEYLGSDKLVALYVLGALTAGIFYLLAFNTVPFFIKSSNFSGMIGASGAIYAIIVGAATLLPNYTFFMLFIGPVKIKYIAAFFIVLSFLGSVQSNMGGNIAHLGGALMGFVYIKQLQAGVNWGGWITTVLDWFVKLFKPSPKVKVTYRKEEPGKIKAEFNKATQAEIDSILDKITERGYESLSKDEKDKLFNAGRKS